jgi:hypothetical protein
MAALPVEFAAAGTLLKLIIVSLCSGQQPVPDRILGDRQQVSVAVRTTPEGTKPHGVLITSQHLENLLINNPGADQHSLPDRSMFEDSAITGQDNPSLSQGGLDQRGVVTIIAVITIQAEQPQPAGQATQVDIENKGSGIGRRRAEMNQSLLVGQNPERYYFDTDTILQPEIESDTLAVGQDHINFRVGNTTGLDRILD